MIMLMTRRMLGAAPGKEDDKIVKSSEVLPCNTLSSATSQVLSTTQILKKNLFETCSGNQSSDTLLLPLLKKRAASLLLFEFFSCNSFPDIVTCKHSNHSGEKERQIWELLEKNF